MKRFSHAKSRHDAGSNHRPLHIHPELVVSEAGLVEETPVIASVSLGAGPYVEASTITATPSATDADSDSVTYTFDWWVNGSSSGIAADNITGVNFNKGDFVFVRVTPSDGAAGSPKDSATVVTVGNTPPSLVSVSFGTGPFYVGDTLTASDFGYIDADGDLAGASSYRWFVKGVFVAGSAGINTGFVRGDTVTVSAAPFDGTDYGVYVIASTVTIQNHKPVMDTLTLSAAPLPATEMSTLSYGATSHDNDAGDTVIEQRMWMVNGSATGITAATLTGASFPTVSPTA